MSLSCSIDLLRKISEIIENMIFSLIFVLREIWYFRQLRKIKKIWYLRWAFLRKCCFSCSVKIKLSHKLPSNQNYLPSKTYAESYSITRTLIVLNKFVFHPNNYLVPLRIWVIESKLVDCSCSYFFSIAS